MTILLRDYIMIIRPTKCEWWWCGIHQRAITICSIYYSTEITVVRLIFLSSSHHQHWSRRSYRHSFWLFCVLSSRKEKFQCDGMKWMDGCLYALPAEIKSQVVWIKREEIVCMHLNLYVYLYRWSVPDPVALNNTKL